MTTTTPMPCRLTVCITNFNTADFVALSLENLRALTTGPYKVLINDNGSAPHDIARLREALRLHPEAECVFRKSAHNQASHAHAEALDLLLARVDTPYAAILDSDCTFLVRGWDEICLSALNERTAIIGTPVCVAAGNRQPKPTDFPFQFAVVLDMAAYRRLGISCAPRDISVGEDTCWQWRPAYLAAGLGCVCFEAVNTRDRKDGPYGSTICAEYWLHVPGRGRTLMACHWGRGSTGGLGKARRNPILRLPLAGPLLQRLAAERDRRRWVAITKRIVAAEVQRALVG